MYMSQHSAHGILSAQEMLVLGITVSDPSGDLGNVPSPPCASVSLSSECGCFRWHILGGAGRPTHLSEMRLVG